MVEIGTNPNRFMTDSDKEPTLPKIILKMGDSGSVPWLKDTRQSHYVRLPPSFYSFVVNKYPVSVIEQGFPTL